MIMLAASSTASMEDALGLLELLVTQLFKVE